MQISVVIPAYNEQEVIEKTIQEVQNFLQQNFEQFEIIVIDDGSSDDTLEVLKNIKNIKVLRNLRNHGKGYTVTKGIKVTRGDLILFMDADNSTSIKELPRLLANIGQNQLVIGSRALPGSIIIARQTKAKEFLGKLGNILIRYLLTPGIHDTQCGFKLFTKEIKLLFNKLTTQGWGFDFELVFLVQRAGFKIKEVPITWQNHGNSKVTLAGYIKTLVELFKIKINHL